LVSDANKDITLPSWLQCSFWIFADDLSFDATKEHYEEQSCGYFTLEDIKVIEAGTQSPAEQKLVLNKKSPPSQNGRL